ncbi:probable Ufm1-specific protease 1 [Drosophila sulfurigaster albostrigata]|uniref:probable Ufm1-specific protease 1 n=1 Tax=Drosophila sulfurigaster albostrigata TaxID=89887 RepID=UPI002D21B7A7|nr:probable Ufm1-specific protease 1 [Drosophila sulfurigaster albostrigata]XP_062129547.1 probable Ufm1-specific protease 1 [Drosophila sulfurigaster albostrigata]
MTTTCELESSANAIEISPKTYSYALFEDVHLALSAAPGQGETLQTRGHFNYFHYGCDGTIDAGWGCGYRTLQTAISWIINKRNATATNVPSIREIQSILVKIGDKLPRFIGSRDWIGTLEECYVLDTLFDVPCKIQHVKQLNCDQVIDQIRQYFVEYAGFIAMGGLSDTASKGIAGIHQSPVAGTFLLVVDPHFSGVPSSKQQLIDAGYVRWMHMDEFRESAYNLCFILQK